MKIDIAVIGGGPAGLAAALKAREEGMNVLILERERELGGVLPQCIHTGFGNIIFKEMLTGPEYANRFIKKVKEAGIMTKTDTTVLEINDKRIIATSVGNVFEIYPKAIILAMGCRERTRSQILIPGDRPAGIYTAGTAQRLINMEGVMPGKEIVILGSGDIGLIMARRFFLEGATVKGVYEILPYPSGLVRNIVQCLEDYNIPLYLSHTVTAIKGRKRLEGVMVAKVDAEMKPIKNTERFVPCDTLILAVGLIPENELSRKAGIEIDERTGGPIVDERMETSVNGIFACGNVVHVHDLVDDVTEISYIAGKNAAKFVKNGLKKRKPIKIVAGKNVSYAVPQIIRGEWEDDVTIYLRVRKEQHNAKLVLSIKKDIIFEKKEKIVRPSEMVKIKIPKDEGKKIEGDEIKIDVEG